MASITFANGTLVPPSWLNDVNLTIYQAIGAGGLAPTTPLQVTTALTFVQLGAGAVTYALLNKLRESTSVPDFAADPLGVADSLAAFNAAATAVGTSGIVAVPPGTWRLSANPSAVGQTTWWIPSNASFTGAGLLPGHTVKLGTYPLTWVNGVSAGAYEYLEANSGLNLRGKPDGISVFSAVRSSQGGGGGTSANIAFAAFGYNDFPAGIAGVWGVYDTMIRKAGTAGATIGMEVDVANMGTTIPILPNAMVSSGQTMCLWIATGGETATNFAVGTASCAIGILRNDANATPSAKFEKGIVFHSLCISGTDGATGTGIAIALATGHVMAWFNNSNQQTAYIYAAAALLQANAQGIVFTNTGINFVLTSDGTINAQISPVAAAANYPQLQAIAAGGTPQYAVAGTDANIDLMLSPKGTGLVKFGTNTAKAAEAFASYITVKDSGGTTRKVMVCV